MTQERKDEVIRIMSQMDCDMQNYVIDTLRHLKFAQDTLCKKGFATMVTGQKESTASPT